MIDLLFSPQGRINRARLWMGALFQVLAMAVVGVVLTILWQVIPGSREADGGFSVNGAIAIPYVLLAFGYIVFVIWSAICLGVKRYHDRDKSGIWVLIQFVPVIGAIWYFIEAGCLRGTTGPNRFGPDPLTQEFVPSLAV